MGSKRNDTLKSESIRPTFRGVCLDRFLHLIEGIEGLATGRQQEAVERELAWVRARTKANLDSLMYSATLMVLRDLLGQGWRILFRQRSVFLSRPEYTRGKHGRSDPALVKERIRESFRQERLAQLTNPSTVRFIRDMEQVKGGRGSIEDLIADGRELARSVRGITSMDDPTDIRQVIRPYLQLVEGETRDEHSGLRLMDIWRYFRYHWAIPYLPTPGRNLFYLVRDAARPNHPVMGIAALGNSIVQLSDRDRFIGWSVDGVEAEFERKNREVRRDLPKGSVCRQVVETEYLESEEEYRDRVRDYARRLARCMMDALDEELALVSHKGLLTKRECDKPTQTIIERLVDVAATSEKDRQKDLRHTHANGRRAKRLEGGNAWREDSESPLFRRKRAHAVAEILSAKLVFQGEKLSANPVEAIRRLLATDEGRKALRIALHANKKTKIGCNLMDIIVCGAIPPYNELLVGKLVAMLMASPQVIHDYADRYGGQPSEIASRLAGKAVVRPAELVFLGTTSLYHVGSSQYERIRIPGPRGGEIAYRFLGYTEGYGSAALSSETTDILRELTIQSQGMRRVNNIFGEGVSPRLRMVREGLALVGIPQTVVLKHSCPRIVYGVELAKNTQEYLRGETNEPRYVFPPQAFRKGTESIIDFWMTRWLVPRSGRKETLQKVETCSKEELLLSREITETSLVAVLP